MAPVAARVPAAAAPAVEVAVIAALADMRKPRIRTGPPPATTTSGWRWLSSQFPPRRPAASDPGPYRDVFSEINARHPPRTASPCRQGVEKAGQLCLIRRKRAVLLSRWHSAIGAGPLREDWLEVGVPGRPREQADWRPGFPSSSAHPVHCHRASAARAACRQSHAAQFSRWGLGRPSIPDEQRRFAPLVVAFRSEYTRYSSFARLVSRAPHRPRRSRHFAYRLLEFNTVPAGCLAASPVMRRRSNRILRRVFPCGERREGEPVVVPRTLPGNPFPEGSS